MGEWSGVMVVLGFGEMVVCELSQLKSEMRALRPTTFNLDQLDNELVLMALIRALPAEFNSLHQTLLLDDSLTLEEAFVALEN